MDYVQSFLIVVLEAACFYLFQDIFIKDNFKRKGIYLPIWIFVISILSFGGSYLFTNFFILKEIFMIAVLGFGLQVLKSGRLRKNLLISVLFICMLAVADLITITIDTQILNHNSGKIVDMLIVLMSKAVLLLLIIILKHLAGEKWGYATDFVDEIWYVIFPIISICVISVILSKGYGIMDKENIYVLWGIIFCLIAMNVLLMFYIKSNSEKNFLLQEKRIFEMDAKRQQVLYRSLEEKIEMQRSLSHEYKNHFTYINALLEQKEYDKISAYIQKINGKAAHDLDMIDTNNPIINTIINTKYYEARKMGAVVVCKINDLSGLDMEEIDIIVLLSNLFNNALEAVLKCKKDRQIKFKIVHEFNELVISFENTYNGNIKRDGDVFRTTKKKEDGFHGIGIKNIIRIVKKYDGDYQFNISENIFQITIIIDTKKVPNL